MQAEHRAFLRQHLCRCYPNEAPQTMRTHSLQLKSSQNKRAKFREMEILATFPDPGQLLAEGNSGISQATIPQTVIEGNNETSQATIPQTADRRQQRDKSGDNTADS